MTDNNATRKECECDRCDRPLRDFIQFDGWANVEPGDDIMVPDDDGDVLMSGRSREPQRSATTVRMYIAAGAKRDDVFRIIRKQLAWLERDPEFFETPDTCPVCGRDCTDDTDAVVSAIRLIRANPELADKLLWRDFMARVVAEANEETP